MSDTKCPVCVLTAAREIAAENQRRCLGRSNPASEAGARLNSKGSEGRLAEPALYYLYATFRLAPNSPATDAHSAPEPDGRHRRGHLGHPSAYGLPKFRGGLADSAVRRVLYNGRVPSIGVGAVGKWPAGGPASASAYPDCGQSHLADPRPTTGSHEGQGCRLVPTDHTGHSVCPYGVSLDLRARASAACHVQVYPDRLGGARCGRRKLRFLLGILRDGIGRPAPTYARGCLSPKSWGLLVTHRRTLSHRPQRVPSWQLWQLPTRQPQRM
jgi:hypothetical protein